MPASRQNVLGSFDPGKDTLETLDPALHFRMDLSAGVMFQTAMFGQPPKVKEQTEPIELVVGSGKRGQTYAYWKGDRLFELPVSYWHGVGWVNSPGYLDGTADFDRPITPRCLECHASYAKAVAESQFSNQFDRASLIPGISCERCHGPGAAHIELHAPQKAGVEANSSKEGADILNMSKLARAQQTDVCAQCHGGLGKDIRPAFSYIPGESLNQFIHLDPPDPRINVDVHGNQVALLERSRCYAESNSLTCTTCHNPHEPEKPAASYSSTCLACHQAKQCGEYANAGERIAESCVDCHMPVQTSKLIESTEDGKELRAQIRSHWIKVYAAESR
jgi:hypothetical protein